MERDAMRCWLCLGASLLLVGCSAGSTPGASPPATPSAGVSQSPPTAPTGIGTVTISTIGAKPGEKASATVRAAPNTLCSIIYTMPDGKVARPAGLGPKMTDAAGRATWTWTIGTTTAPGIGKVAVECGGAGAAERILIGVRE